MIVVTKTDRASLIQIKVFAWVRRVKFLVIVRAVTPKCHCASDTADSPSPKNKNKVRPEESVAGLLAGSPSPAKAPPGGKDPARRLATPNAALP